MALIAPLAGAALGGVLTGGAGWAMSAGWLIGSWLFQKKNDDQNTIIDPGAQEMPRINQALRGITMPVLFGTNRVSSQIVWQKNFTTIRHESTQGGGGGKGGGSGMGAKGGGPSTTQATYEYKWDLFMHLGMVSEDFSLFGGWLGPERLNSETLLAIINNSNSGFGAGLFRSDVDRPQNASLTFDEGFYHGGQATGDTNAVNWDHFESQEGQPFRFPYTCYVGFKQLNLGSSAAVPQLSWEVGPGNIDLDFNTEFSDYYDAASTGPSMSYGPTGGLLRGEDGKLYIWDNGSGNDLGKLRNVTDKVDVDTVTDTEFDAFATGLGLDPGTAYDFTSTNGSAIIPNTNYILMYGQDIGTGSRSNWAFVIFKVNSSGSLETVGGYQGRKTISDRILSGCSITIFGEGTVDDPIIISSNSSVSSTDEYWIARLPSINEFIGIVIEDTASANYGDRLVSVQLAVTEIKDNFSVQSSYRNYTENGWVFYVPTVSIGVLGPTWGTKMMIYIGKSDIEWHLDNPASLSGTDTIYDITGTHPNGGIFSIDISLDGAQSLSLSSTWTDESSNWIDASTESSVIPFADSGRLVDETTISDGDDYDPNPAVQKLTSGAGAGATLVTFFKTTTAGSADRGATNTFTQVQAFLWNPLDQVAKRYVKKNGSFADASTDWGVGGAYTQAGTSGWYDESTGTLYITGGVDGGGASDDTFVSVIGQFDIGGGEDVLPPFIIHEILTSTVFGFNIPTSAINQTSYQLALQYCEAEDIRVSVQYRREEGKLQAINDLLALYGGYLIDSGGEIKFGLTTFTDGTYGSVVRTIDNDHLLVTQEGEAPVQITRGARQDTYNKVKVNYFDRDLEYRQNFVEITDEVDIDLHGTRAQEFPPKFVMKEGVAAKLAARALWSNLYTRDIYNFRLGPKNSDLEPGDVVTLVDSFQSKLQSGKQVRIVTWVEREPLIFDVQATDDVQYVSTNDDLGVDSQQLATQNTLFGPALPAADFTMYELPKEFQGANAQVFVGYRQQSASKGARLYTSADGVSFAQVQEVQPFIISGIFPEPLPAREPGFVEEGVIVYLMPDTASGNWSVASDTWAQTFQLDDVGPAGRAVGAGMFWSNSEMMAVEGVSLLGQNQYRFDKVYRGWGGTHIQGHASGDSWHKHGGGIFTQAINEDKIGSIIHYKVAPFNFAGVEYDISSVDARTYQLKGTYFIPQNPPSIKTFVQSPGSFLTVQSENLGYITKKNVIAGGSTVQFEWQESARARGYGARGYGTGEYGRFEQDTSSVAWRVEVLSNDLTTVVRCTSVDTPIFTYSSDINSTDFNGWTGAFATRVTAFNEFGDSLRSRTKILELFE